MGDLAQNVSVATCALLFLAPNAKKCQSARTKRDRLEVKDEQFAHYCLFRTRDTAAKKIAPCTGTYRFSSATLRSARIQAHTFEHWNELSCNELRASALLPVCPLVAHLQARALRVAIVPTRTLRAFEQ